MINNINKAIVLLFLPHLLFAVESSTYLSRICEFDVEKKIALGETGNYAIKSEIISYNIKENMEVYITYCYKIVKIRPNENNAFGLSLRNRGMMHGGGTSDTKLNILNIVINGRNARVNYIDSPYSFFDDNCNPIINYDINEHFGEYINDGYKGWYYFIVDFINSNEANIEISYKTTFGLGIFDDEEIRYNSKPFWIPVSNDAEIKILIENERNNAFLCNITGCEPMDSLVTENWQLSKTNLNTVSIIYTPAWYSEINGIYILFADLYASLGSPNLHFFKVNLKDFWAGGNGPDDGVYIYSRGRMSDGNNLSRRELKMYELIFLNGWQLRIMRNAFYAVHKYRFNDTQLNQILYGLHLDYIKDDWFVNNVNEITFSSIEKRNIEIIQFLENMLQ
jgi:hypothetical protein